MIQVTIKSVLNLFYSVLHFLYQYWVVFLRVEPPSVGSKNAIIYFITDCSKHELHDHCNYYPPDGRPMAKY